MGVPQPLHRILTLRPLTLSSAIVYLAPQESHVIFIVPRACRIEAAAQSGYFPGGRIKALPGGGRQRSERRDLSKIRARWRHRSVSGPRAARLTEVGLSPDVSL